MQSQNLLLPNKFKKAGWIIFIPSLILLFAQMIFGFEFSWLKTKVFSVFPAIFSGHGFGRLVDVNLTNTIIGVLFISGALLVGFSKEKIEDEYISNLRLSSLLWAVLLNYSLLLVAFIFIYDIAFLSVMVYNMFTVLLIFIFRFQYLLFKNSKAASNEK